MKQDNRLKGGVGEGIAAQFLERKGYEILEKNARTKFGELDLICLDGEVIVFVEVKLKVGEDYGTPEEMIDKHKLAQVTRTAELYLLQKKELGGYEQQRIDAVCIVLTRENEVDRIDHYENIGF